MRLTKEDVEKKYSIIESRGNFYLVKKDGKYGFISYNGMPVVPCELDGLTVCINGVFMEVFRDGKAGFFFQNGEYIAPVFDEVYECGFGDTMVKNDGKVGYVNSSHQFTENRDESAFYFDDVLYPGVLAPIPALENAWKAFDAETDKEKCLKNPEVFFTSNLMFGAEEALKKYNRPFSTVEEMNETIVKNWNERVCPQDVVYCLGDFGDLEFVKRLNGRVNIVLGKEELKRLNDLYLDPEEYKYEMQEQGFNNVSTAGALIVKSAGFMAPEMENARFSMSYEKRPEGKDMLALVGKFGNATEMDPNVLQVATDLHGFCPLTETQVKEYFMSQNIAN